MNIERRQFSIQGLKLEARDKEATRMIGHAAVFNTWADIGGYFRERIVPGAFKRAIKEDDVRALFNHDANFVLGRNKAGTLLLEEDDTGLAIQIFPPETSFARDLGISMERGDIDQMSFGFRTLKDQWNYEPRIPERTLLEVELFDISPVTFPAYPTTDVGMRTIEAYRKEHPAGGLTTVNASAIVRSRRQQAYRHG